MGRGRAGFYGDLSVDTLEDPLKMEYKSSYYICEYLFRLITVITNNKFCNLTNSTNITKARKITF